MKRVKLIVAYDGTNYHGWQMQTNGLSIEEVLNDTLTALLKEPITVIGASRTDSGVHALGNVAVFDTENRMPADKICFALNQRLPEDIRIQSSEEVPLDWHPRKQNCVKTYEYRILNRKIDMPVNRLYTYFCYFPIDVEKMRQGAGYLVGEHDFKSFCTARTQAEETVRTIYSLTVEQGEDDIVTIRICGSGFLYNMVRIIAGTLLRVGTGLYGPEKVEEILDARNRRAAGPTLPAKGLTLISLDYERVLQPEIKVSNKYWEYLLVQREILPKKKAYLVVHRCAEQEFDRLVARLVHQSVRNGAKRIYVVDMEGWEKGQEEPSQKLQQPGRSFRIWEGKRFGYYEMKRSHRYLEMEKLVESDVSRRVQENGLKPEETGGETVNSFASSGGEAVNISVSSGDKAVNTVISSDGKAVNSSVSLKGKTVNTSISSDDKPVKDEKISSVELCPLAREDWGKWLAWYNESFFSVPGSQTYDEEAIINQEKDGGLFFWICAGGSRVGTLILECKKSEGEELNRKESNQRELKQEKSNPEESNQEELNPEESNQEELNPEESNQEKGKEGTVFIDVIAVKQEYTGQGYGMGTLCRVEEYAREQGIRKLSLMVADSNEKARRLYERAGFRIVRQRPDFFCGEADGRIDGKTGID